MKTISKKLVNLATKIKNDESEESGIKLMELIQNILETKGLDLTDIVNDTLDYTDDADVLITLKYYCEEMSSSDIIYDEKDNAYITTLFVVPLLFQKPEKLKIKNIDKNNLLFGELIKTFKKTGVIEEESNVFIHNYLYHPIELINANYNQVNNIFKSMQMIALNRSNDLKNLNAIKCKDLNYDKETFDIRYMLGIKITKENENEELNENKFNESLENFTSTFSDLLTKLFKIQIEALPIENFHRGLEAGLEIYISFERRTNIQKSLTSNNIHAHGVTALLDINFNDFESSKIKLISKLNNEIIADINLNSLYFQSPEKLMDLVSEELTDLDINMKDIFVKIENNKIPISTILKNEDNGLQIKNKLH